MPLAQCSDAIEGLAALAALAAVIYGPWSRLCKNYARDIVFEAREKLFDLAADGQLSFADDGYREARAAMNAMVRLAHRMSLPRLIAYRLAYRQVNPNTRHSRPFVGISSIGDENTKRAVEALVCDAELAIFIMACARSPVTTIIAAAILFYRILGGGVTRIRSNTLSFARAPIESAINAEVLAIR